MLRNAVIASSLALTLCSAAWSLAAEAQSAKVYQIGVVFPGGPYQRTVDGLRDGLKAVGFEEGRQFILYVQDT